MLIKLQVVILQYTVQKADRVYLNYVVRYRERLQGQILVLKSTEPHFSVNMIIFNLKLITSSNFSKPIVIILKRLLIVLMRLME